MKTLDAQFLAAIGADTTYPLMLVEIGFATPLRLNTRETLVWNGYSWGADRQLEISINDSGASLTLGNHDDLIGGYLLNQRIAGRAITIWEAWLDGATMHVRQSLVGIGGQARCGADVAVIELAPGSTMAHAPRQLIRTLIGWPPPKPDGYRQPWGDSVYVVEGRQ